MSARKKIGFGTVGLLGLAVAAVVVVLLTDTSRVKRRGRSAAPANAAADAAEDLLSAKTEGGTALRPPPADERILTPDAVDPTLAEIPLLPVDAPGARGGRPQGGRAEKTAGGISAPPAIPDGGAPDGAGGTDDDPDGGAARRGGTVAGGGPGMPEPNPAAERAREILREGVASGASPQEIIDKLKKELTASHEAWMPIAEEMMAKIRAGDRAGAREYVEKQNAELAKKGLRPFPVPAALRE
jgi:hypothetical protein